MADVSLSKDMTIRGMERRSGSPPIRAIIAYDNAYVQPLIVAALKSLVPEDVLDMVSEVPGSDSSLSVPGMISAPDSRVFQITPYESIDFEFAAAHPRSCLVNSYMIRKALIRKHYLSAMVDHWVAKKPASPLKKHVKRSEAFEVDYAEILDDALVEAFDLGESMCRNAGGDAAQREWWILKPGMSDRGQGIRLFSTMDELQAIFDGWEGERPDSDDDGDDDDKQPGDETSPGEDRSDYITASHLRHFVAQPYIHPPLLLVEPNARKFHIRTYVLCTGSLTVHVFKPMLALFAAKPYVPPWTHASDDVDSFLTNTCLQEQVSNPTGRSSVRRFWDLPLPGQTLDDIFSQICTVTGEVFEAAARVMPVHFQTLPNAFEVFGLDFLVDAKGVAWLLEVNAFPDFKQTGGGLREIVEGFWRGVVSKAVMPFFGIEARVDKDDGMVLVRQTDLGRR